jgi:hypothetical protein
MEAVLQRMLDSRVYFFCKKRNADVYFDESTVGQDWFDENALIDQECIYAGGIRSTWHALIGSQLSLINERSSPNNAV